jgi:F0F1-type ATP synthase membrane subunit c/vacuolar-type H+-ATPase subunit K
MSGYFLDNIPIVGRASRAVRNAYETVEQAAASIVPAVSEYGRAMMSGFYEHVVAVPGLTPEQAWIVFFATVAVGVGTGGAGLAAGLAVRTAAKATAKIAVREIAKSSAVRAAKCSAITAAVGWAVFFGMPGGGEPSPELPGGDAEPAEPAAGLDDEEAVGAQEAPPLRKVAISIEPDGYSVGGGALLDKSQFSTWAAAEFDEPGPLDVVLQVSDESPMYLVNHAESTLRSMSARRVSTGSYPTTLAIREE